MPNPLSKYPSVTTALAPYSGFDRANPDTLAAACAIGSSVHTAALSRAAGRFVLVDTSVWGYYESFVEWHDSFVAEVLAVEPLWESHKWGFCGSPDLLVRLKGEQTPSIWDLKTSVATGRTWCAQLAAYRVLALENGYETIGRVASLRLKSDGSMPLADDYQSSDRDFAAFLSALNAWRYFNA